MRRSIESSNKLTRRPAPLLMLGALFFLGIAAEAGAEGKEWRVPVGGNVFPVHDGSNFHQPGRDGTAWLSGEQDAVAIYFHVNQACRLQLAIVAVSESGEAEIRAHVADEEFTFSIADDQPAGQPIGEIAVAEPGYVCIELRGPAENTATRVKVRELLVQSDEEQLEVTFVRSNDGNMFYWGRRGPSVHLSYRVPQDLDIQYAYNEITVPKGEDPIGSYFMANGFAEGYFGIQVNSETERRVLFSVWSPFRTDDPREIPADQRIVAIARGADTQIGEFGNEGSGGQSFMRYPWKAGQTYRFLTEVVPQNDEKTRYTCWFSAVDKPWRLVASFLRPKTQTHLQGFHSFLENFAPTQGNLQRRAFYGNQWVVDIEGGWHECTSARFSVDATGGGKHRLDFRGGADGSRFFLQNCGFFLQTGKPGEIFTRLENAAGHPQIQFDKLPRE